MGDVVYTDGTKMLYHTEKHLHSKQEVAPDLAAAIPVSSHATTAWLYGTASATIVTPTKEFDVHWIEIDPVSSAAAEYQLAILGNGSIIAKICWTILAGVPRSYSKSVIMERQPANTVVTAQLACSLTSSQTIKIKLEWHDYH